MVRALFIFVWLGADVAHALDVVPGLTAFGTDTRAAYGNGVDPTICIVTSLDPNATVADEVRNGVPVKTGGLRRLIDLAVENKVILFEVSGTIDGPAAGVYKPVVSHDYLTIAGQTAPSPGITLKGIKLSIRANHVLVQHLRLRLGDALKPGEGISWLQNRDCLGIGNFPDTDLHHVVVDHCSYSWSMDENVNVYNADGGHISQVTLSNSISSEGLYANVRCDYDPAYDHHSKGLLISNQNAPTQIAVINNLLAHNEDRNPVVNDGSSIVVNNLAYDGGVSCKAKSVNVPTSTSFVGNVVIAGPSSRAEVDYAVSIANHAWRPWPADGVGSAIYVADNLCTLCSSEPWDGVHDQGNLESTVRVEVPPIWPAGYVAMPGSTVETFLLASAGARPLDRDAVDLRIVNDVTAGTGTWIDSQNEVGGWPTLAETHRQLSLPSDPHADDDGDGYTNLEEMLHQMHFDLLPRGATDNTPPAVTPLSPSGSAACAP